MKKEVVYNITGPGDIPNRLGRAYHSEGIPKELAINPTIYYEFLWMFRDVIVMEKSAVLRKKRFGFLFNVPVSVDATLNHSGASSQIRITSE